MAQKLRCPRMDKRRPTSEPEHTDDRCLLCPALMREVNERGAVSLYCLVYGKRLQPAKPGIYVTAGAHTVTAWRWEKQRNGRG
jgi:hypothetical protein